MKFSSQFLPKSFLNGYQSLINVWRDALAAKAVKIQTKTKVTQILWQNSTGAVLVKTQNGTTFEADHVIITVSLGTYAHIATNEFENEILNLC